MRAMKLEEAAQQLELSQVPAVSPSPGQELRPPAASHGGGSTHSPQVDPHILPAKSSAQPASPDIGAPVPDLTRIAARRGGTFPADEVYRIIDCQSDLLPSGPRHMPVWGYEFFDAEKDDQAAHQQAINKVQRLVNYLRSLQRPE